MQIEVNSSTLSLAPASLLAVQDGTGTRILVRSGSLWVTQEGDLKDAVVRAGEVLTIRRSGRTVVSALEASTLTLIGAGAPDDSGQRQKTLASVAAAGLAPCT